MAPGTVAWVSRIALGLGYASQRMDVAERRLKRLVEGVDRGRRRNAMRCMRRRQSQK
jgi:hypothetical protein